MISLFLSYSQMHFFFLSLKGGALLLAGVPDTAGYADGPLESALFNLPSRLILDDGHLLVVRGVIFQIENI